MRRPSADAKNLTSTPSRPATLNDGAGKLDGLPLRCDEAVRAWHRLRPAVKRCGRR